MVRPSSPRNLLSLFLLLQLKTLGDPCRLQAPPQPTCPLGHSLHVCSPRGPRAGHTEPMGRGAQPNTPAVEKVPGRSPAVSGQQGLERPGAGTGQTQHCRLGSGLALQLEPQLPNPHKRDRSHAYTKALSVVPGRARSEHQPLDAACVKTATAKEVGGQGGRWPGRASQDHSG